MAARTCDEALGELRKFGVPSDKIQTILEIVKDPQLRARNIFSELYHLGVERNVEILGSALRLSEIPGKVKTGFPTLGEDTEEILKTILYYGTEEIENLKAEHVLE